MDGKSTYRDFGELVRAELLTFVVRLMQRLGYSDFGEPNGFAVETVHLKLKRLPHVFSAFRIAQISDLHMGGWMNAERLQQVVDLVIAQKPEILVITGDFLKGRSFTEPAMQAIRALTKILSSLATSIPTFAVLGNHDYWTNPDAIREMLRHCGITDLTNTASAVTREDQSLYLCGVDDIRHGDVRLDDVIAQLDENSVAILLAHEPDFADTSAATGADLVSYPWWASCPSLLWTSCPAPFGTKISQWALQSWKYVSIYKPWSWHGYCVSSDQLSA